MPDHAPLSIKFLVRMAVLKFCRCELHHTMQWKLCNTGRLSIVLFGAHAARSKSLCAFCPRHCLAGGSRELQTR